MLEQTNNRRISESKWSKNKAHFDCGKYLNFQDHDLCIKNVKLKAQNFRLISSVFNNDHITLFALGLINFGRTIITYIIRNRNAS